MDKFDILTQKLEEFLDMGLPFYDCIVMKDGECVYRSQGGSFEDGSKPTGKELYNIYSCSKLITCTAALMLWEKGLFRLEDELSEYMPEFTEMTVNKDGKLVPAENKITVEQLFTMTAGFSYDLGTPRIQLCREQTDGKSPTRELMRYLADEPLLFEPGYRWEYSLCHDVLAALVEVVSGMKFGEYVKKNIFDVLGMENSTFGLPIGELDSLCTQYRYDAESGEVKVSTKTNAYKLGTEYESGGAGCVSTVDDYIKFLEAMRTYKLLKRETTELLATNRLSDEQRAMPTYWVGEKRGYGLGQQCPSHDNPRPDFGWGGAAGAHYFVDIPNGITAYLGTHVIGFEKYQNARTEITPIIQKILGND